MSAAMIAAAPAVTSGAQTESEHAEKAPVLTGISVQETETVTDTIIFRKAVSGAVPAATGIVRSLHAPQALMSASLTGTE